MNIYRFAFRARCPVDGAVVSYAAEIRSPAMIRAEELSGWAAKQVEGFHEDFADQLCAAFGGEQRIIAVHAGVQIETVRP